MESVCSGLAAVLTPAGPSWAGTAGGQCTAVLVSQRHVCRHGQSVTCPIYWLSMLPKLVCVEVALKNQGKAGSRSLG